MNVRYQHLRSTGRQARNAFDDALIHDLTAAYRAIAVDTAVRVVVLRGAGTAFCAGADLGWMRRSVGYSIEENRADAGALHALFDAIAACPAATIARVHGPAIGGGAGLAAVCDIAIAANAAVFGLSEVRLGLVPAVIAPYIIERIGPGMARSLFLTGERFDAVRAERMGLIHRCVPDGELDDAVSSTMRLLLQAGPAAVRAAQRAYPRYLREEPRPKRQTPRWSASQPSVSARRPRRVCARSWRSGGEKLAPEADRQ